MVLSAIKSRVDQMTAGARLSLVAVGTLAIATVLALTARPMLALLFVLIVIFVVGLLWFVSWAIKARARAREKSFDTGMAGDALDEFKDHWKQAVDEFRSTGVDRYNFGFYMLIGEPASGKSTTLRKSGLNFPIGMEAISGAGGTRNCDWWFPDEAIILDTAGRLTFHEDVETDERSWKLFLQLLKTYKPHAPITGVIVVIPCTSLLEDSDEERHRKAEIIRNSLTEIERTLEVQFPVYVLVTKADRIGGFSEFFAHLKTMEQFQLFGWSRPRSRFGTRFDPAELDEAFHGILERLRKVRFGLIHEAAAGDPHKFARIFPFPEEFEALQKPLAGYLETVFPESKLLEPLLFQGFYVTSGLQQGVPVLQACASLFGGSEGHDDELQEALEQERVYFIRDFYRKKLFQERGLVFPTGARIKKVKFFERLGYGAALAVGLIGILVLTLHALGIKRQVEAPSAVLDSIKHMMRDGIDTGRPAEIGKALAAAFELAEIDESGGLAGLIPRIHRRETLSNFSILGVGDAERDSMLTNLARVQRSLFVRLLRPLLVEVEAELAGQESTDLLDPGRFGTHREVFLSFMKLRTQDGVSADTPRSLMPLFEFARARLGPEAFRLASDIDKLYRTLLRVDSLTSPPLLSGLERTTQDQYRALGIPEAGLASDRDRTLRRGLDMHRERWVAFLEPENEITLPSTSVSEPVRTAYVWGRLRVLHDRINAALGRLEQIQNDGSFRSRDSGEFIYGWEGRNREDFAWLTEYATLERSLGEIRRMLGDGQRPLRAWDDCLRDLERTELRDAFYLELKQLPGYQGSVESAERELLAALSGIKASLLEDFPLERDKWNQSERKGFLFVVEPVEKPAEGERVFRLSWKFEGIPPKELLGTRRMLDEFVSLKERGSGKPAGAAWEDVFADSKHDASGKEQPRLQLRLQFLRRPLEFLRAHSKRLQDSVDEAGIADSSRSMRRITRFAIHCLAMKYLRDLHKRHAKGQPALLARMVQGGQREVDAAELAEGFAAEAPAGLVAYADAICQWTEELSLPAPIERFPGGRRETLQRVLDDMGARYLTDWYSYWSQAYFSEEREQLAQIVAKAGWQDFAASAVKTLDAGSIAAYGAALQRYSEGIHLGKLPTRGRLLPETRAAWRKHGTVLARVAKLWTPDFGAELNTSLERIRDFLEEDGDPMGALKLEGDLLLCQKRLEQLPPSAKRIRIPVLGDLDALCKRARELLSLRVSARIQDEWNRICADAKLNGVPLRSGSGSLSAAAADRFFRRESGMLDTFLARFDPVLGIRTKPSSLLEPSPAPQLVTSLRQCVAWQDFLLGEAKSLSESQGLEFEIRLEDHVALGKRFTRLDHLELRDTGADSAVLRRDIPSKRRWSFVKDASFRLEGKLAGQAELDLGRPAKPAIVLEGPFGILAFIDRYLPRKGGGWAKARGQKHIVLKVPARSAGVAGTVDLRIEFPGTFPGEFPNPTPWNPER